MPDKTLPLVTRLWFAFVCSMRVLLDGRCAARVWAVRDVLAELPPAAPDDGDRDDEGASDEVDDAKQQSPQAAEETPPSAPRDSQALVLLALLQREGRLIDFLEQDIAEFDDNDIGAAARVVHDGCRKALRDHSKLTALRSEEEESTVKIADGIDTGEVKLTGDVSGKPPYRGVLRHRGWRVSELQLPTPQAGHDPEVVAPAEVEL